ncbi:MAG: hypothetical protein AMS21_00330 [Gemmatimonas sp. SG8_38_2]|nr:MAG: hypothetical protein AMS21_00330 [Gemmatimonas sp. SG8_38_2]
MTDDSRGADSAWEHRVTQTVIRLSLLALLAFWCLRFVSPFINPIIGGIVIAIAVQTPYVKLTRAIGGRPRTAAVVLTLIALLILIVPSIVLGASLVDTARTLTGELDAQDLAVPPPPGRVADLPLVGESVYQTWLAASQNLEAALVKLAPHLKDAGLWLVSTVGHLGRGLLMLLLAILIAGALLPFGQRGAAFARRAASSVAGGRGPELAALAASSIQSVTRGVLGVAIIQALLAGLGMLVVGVPAAGLWSLLILIFAVMQLPSMIVIIPIIFYVFSTSSIAASVLFAIWGALVGLSDNVLKPLLMGRGSSVPMLVLFMGSLGGFIASGILGLFVGAVVLSLGYTVLMAWLEGSAVEEEDPATAPTEIHQ